MYDNELNKLTYGEAIKTGATVGGLIAGVVAIASITSAIVIRIIR